MVIKTPLLVNSHHLWLILYAVLFLEHIFRSLFLLLTSLVALSNFSEWKCSFAFVFFLPRPLSLLPTPSYPILYRWVSLLVSSSPPPSLLLLWLRHVFLISLWLANQKLLLLLNIILIARTSGNLSLMGMCDFWPDLLFIFFLPKHDMVVEGRHNWIIKLLFWVVLHWKGFLLNSFISCSPCSPNQIK